MAKVDGGMRIAHNDSLVNISGPKSLTKVGGQLLIEQNQKLIRWDNNLEIVGCLKICGNEALISLEWLKFLMSVVNDLIIGDNPLLMTLNNLKTSPKKIKGSLTIADNGDNSLKYLNQVNTDMIIRSYIAPIFFNSRI